MRAVVLVRFAAFKLNDGLSGAEGSVAVYFTRVVVRKVAALPDVRKG